MTQSPIHSHSFAQFLRRLHDDPYSSRSQGYKASWPGEIKSRNKGYDPILPNTIHRRDKGYEPASPGTIHRRKLGGIEHIEPGLANMSGIAGVIARIGLTLWGQSWDNSSAQAQPELDPLNDGNWIDKIVAQNAKDHSTGASYCSLNELPSYCLYLELRRLKYEHDVLVKLSSSGLPIDHSKNFVFKPRR